MHLLIIFVVTLVEGRPTKDRQVREERLHEQKHTWRRKLAGATLGSTCSQNADCTAGLFCDCGNSAGRRLFGAPTAATCTCNNAPPPPSPAPTPPPPPPPPAKCGSLLQQSSVQSVAGWTLCYLSGAQTAYHTTACNSLFVGVPVPSIFGCWHFQPGTYDPVTGAGNPSAACADIQKTTLYNAWAGTTHNMVVCVQD